MKDLVLDDTLSVQVQEIDDDHRRLVELFNLLNHSVEDGDTPDYIEALLDELISCTAWHFKHEERLMTKYNYDELKEHKAEHQELIESAKELQQIFYKNNKSLSGEDIESLEQWLTGHILGADMALGSYLGEVM
ncbi:MAG: bacteriohemerythrin [Gammaproteobacteria bacterium]|nr:bacteriohemerythrin [Gammaproteobacteria bacterium]